MGVPLHETHEDPRPDVSVVVTLYNEAGSLDELYRRTVSSLDGTGRPYEIVFVDDGSTDGTFAELERLHAGDDRVRAVRFRRNFGQHPAMHAGLARARGDVVVTMDGDLQNAPEDIPKLVAAVEGGADVASGRRVARRDPWGRTLPSKLINGMLRRFTGVAVSDFGCAFNAYRRDAITPMLGAIGKQKFTKALVLSGGASVVEVDVQHAARRGSSRYSPLRLTRLALHVLAGFWPQPIQWIGVTLGVVCSLAAFALGVYGVAYWIGEDDFPGPLFGGAAIVFVLGIQGFILALVGEYLGKNPARRGRPASLHDRARVVSKRVLVDRRRRLHLVERRPAPARRHGARGRVARRAHVRGQHREPRRRDVPRAALVRGGRHPRRRARARGRGGRGRDRERGRRVARREVDPRGRLRVRDDERRGHADPARRRSRDARRALRPHLVERGVRHGRASAHGRGASAQPAQPVRGDEGGRRPAGVRVRGDVRPAHRHPPAVQQLRAEAAPREARPALHHERARGRAADRARRRLGVTGLAVRRRRRRGDRSGDRRRPRALSRDR